MMELNSSGLTQENVDSIKLLASCLREEIKKTIVGKDELIKDILICLIAEGNVMLDGVPGLAKTSIAKTFASVLNLEFKRIQFVPDMLPSDVTGWYIYDQKESRFNLRKGPVFTNILLVDEINRASPKTQSALLEAMEEKQVSIDGNTFSLPLPFMMIATQNPIDVIGTFPLPEAQIDRFMFKLKVDYPSNEEELDILRMKRQGEHVETEVLLSHDHVVNLIEMAKQVYVDDRVLTYIRDVIMATRVHDKLLLGGSPRGSIALLKASRALAVLNGRNYVIPDDVKYLIPRVMNHRLVVKPEYELEDLTSEQVMAEIVERVKIPE